MTTEEKAKTYDEAIKRAKNFIENGDERERTIAESIFAGIMEESEDEKIRKALIDFFREPGRKEYILNEFNVDNIIAWLEKQNKIQT